ncbi:Phenylalanine ammonia-lyase [Bienertia sinuspersici]
MGESLIPRFIALGREKKYLRYVVEKGELHSRMQLISDKVVSDHEKLFTKLELVRAESITSSENEALVHIRSCYNNKFLVLSKDVENWVVAEADEPKEDRSKWSCTLFRLGRGQQSVRLFLQAAGAEHGVVVDATEKCLTIGNYNRVLTFFLIIDSVLQHNSANLFK